MTRAVSDIERAIAYHDRTKHYPQRFARSLGYLDWATQPNPFRRYEGARLFRLPFAKDSTGSYEGLYSSSAGTRKLSVESLSEFLEMSLAVSAWKESQGVRWALRCNPSSGNLHPTEGYVVAGPLEGLSETGGVYHYAAAEHGLEARATLADWEFPEGVFFVGLTSVFWREAWKYGERAFRYCQHDAGHAMAAVSFAAAALGWRAVHLDSASDAEVAALLGVDRLDEFPVEEREHPDALFAVVPASLDVDRSVLGRIVDTAPDAWHGRANALSHDHVEWDVIDAVAEATLKQRTITHQHGRGTDLSLSSNEHVCGATTKTIFLQRRSAVDMDGETTISRDAFYTMLDRTLPRRDRTPWWSVHFAPSIHLGIFVHRVEGLEPGMYMLVRDREVLPRFKAAMNPQLLWETPPGCAPNAPLYALGYGDVRSFAAQASCGQAIAGDSAFSLGMIADFEATLEREGAWAYRRLYWEAGMIGQVLYLEAEAAGVRSTGIGCYFDDIVHHAFGLKGHAFQSMYHFTVGGPVDDDRLTTLPSYSTGRRAEAGWT